MKEEVTRRDSWRIFNRIAHRYDFLNRLLSFRQDVRWRKKAVRLLEQMNIPVDRCLDLATGTCDQIISLCRKYRRLKIVGMDMSQNMLTIGREKIKKCCDGKSVYLVRGDGMSIGCKNNYFDLITVSFGIRNFASIDKGFEEMHRVLSPQGYLLILEFSLPENTIFKYIYLFYFRKMLPKLGGIISGDIQAYRYLNLTVEAFPYGDAFRAMLRQADFNVLHSYSLFFGIATIYLAQKKPQRQRG
jgi:demethylmenaquinone methyltransferase/2-methoxy-6-polyprenyl-1,4-benzoquinol methylase